MEQLISGTINIRGAGGNKVLENVNLGQTLGEFISLLGRELNLSEESIVIKKGFPPRPIDR